MKTSHLDTVDCNEHGIHQFAVLLISCWVCTFAFIFFMAIPDVWCWLNIVLKAIL